MYRPWECDEEKPSWGPFKPDDLVPVKVTVETTLEPIEIKLPIDLQDCLVYVADSTAVRAGELVGKNLPKGHYYEVAVRFSDEADKKKVNSLVGKTIFFGDLYLCKKLIGIVDFPIEGDNRWKDWYNRADAILVCEGVSLNSV